MSATLTWASSGNYAKTGTSNANLLDDIDTAVSSFSGNAAFSWQKAGKSSAATPRWLLLSRKDGSAGRIALIIFDSAPAANNAAILDTTPTSNLLQLVWFPNGSANTLSNLTAASGTVCGNDTGAVKCTGVATVASLYAATELGFFFDSAEGMVFGFQNTAGGDGYMLGAGALVVDGADVAYGCCFSNGSLNSWGSTFGWSFNAATFPLAGGNTGVIRTNYGSTNRAYWPAWSPSGWAQVLAGANDMLVDFSLQKEWFVAIPLVAGQLSTGGVPKGEGFTLKLRQIGVSYNTLGSFTVDNLTGPVPQARQFCNRVAGSGTTGLPWLTNFKI